MKLSKLNPLIAAAAWCVISTSAFSQSAAPSTSQFNPSNNTLTMSMVTIDQALTVSDITIQFTSFGSVSMGTSFAGSGPEFHSSDNTLTLPILHIGSIPYANVKIQNANFSIQTYGRVSQVSTSIGTSPPAVVTINDQGETNFNGSNLNTALTALPTEALSAAEQSSLVYMREEEKLAGDVYAKLGTTWGLRVFSNISSSESTHTEAVRQLLVRYGVSDPAANLATGVFANATLQSLYTQLVASGSVSLIEALKVGAAIEELDMLDINTHLRSVDNQDIRLVYDNLLKGSRNHLRSFYKTLQQQGGSYTAQYLTQAEFDAIVNSATER